MKRNIRTACLAWCCFVGASFLASGCTKQPARFQGYMEGQYSYFAAPLSGNLRRLPVGRGDRIGSDSLLFSVDPVDSDYSVKKQYHQWQSSLKTLQDMKEGKRPSEIDALKAQLVQAQASADRSAQQFRRAEADYKIQGISLDKLEAIRATAKADDARVKEIDSQLRTASLPARDAQILAQQQSTEAMQAEYERTKRQYDQMSTTAGGAGVVVDTFYKVGEWVPAGSPVVKILTDGSTKVRFFLPEGRLSQVHVGQSVTLTCDGCTKAYRAKITYIAPDAEYTPPVIYSNDARAKLVFLIEAQPSAGDTELLHPGMPVEVAL